MRRVVLGAARGINCATEEEQRSQFFPPHPTRNAPSAQEALLELAGHRVYLSLSFLLLLCIDRYQLSPRITRSSYPSISHIAKATRKIILSLRVLLRVSLPARHGNSSQTPSAR